jgi:16S rRNA (cytosine967-C5)-methyltransferase
VLPRDLALETLNSLDHGPGFPERYLERAFQKDPHVSERDRAFTVNLVQGVFRWRFRFDWIIKQTARTSFSIEPLILNILRIALYQIFFMDRVPQSAAVNEAVKQTRAAGKGHATGFVNGILRHICRHKDQIVFPDSEKDRIRYLSVFYSYPTWLVKKWIRELGIDSAERLLAAGNQVPSLVVRANSLRIDRPGLIKHLEREGVTGMPTLYSPEGIKVDGLKGPVTQLNAFKEGLFQVQGEAAQACSHLLFPRPGESILDLCAGLGGKSTHLAELMGGKGWILALDMSHGRLIRLTQSSRRLGIGCVQPIVADATNHLSSFVRRSFDKVLIDGPCSGLGNISRHPDGKWTRHEGDIKRLALLQKSILDEAVPILRKGGTMLYVTCTISREENEEVVSDFLEKNRGVTLENLKDHVPEWCLDFIDDQGFFKTFPHIHGTDGFFAALFMKR